MQAIKHFTTTDELIDLYGGDEAVAKYFGLGQNAVRMWRTDRRGYFPPYTYAEWHRMMKRRRYAAPDALWKQLVPPSKEKPSHERPTDGPDVHPAHPVP